MSKEELAKRYQEIVLKTNGGADDYVVALCQIANLISEAGKEIEEQTNQLAELKAKLRESNRINEKNRLEIEKLKKNDKLLKEKMADNSKLTLENEQLKAENERLKENNKSKLIELFNDENKKLKQQLKEKDEEIARLNGQLKNWQQLSVTNNGAMTAKQFSEMLKLNTHQVCEKIKEKTFGLWYFVLEEQKEHFEGNRYVLSKKDFDDILYQIEKGIE